MGENDTSDIVALKKFSYVVLAVSIFFWCWALLNTLTKGFFDLGVVSLFATSLSSLYLITTVNKRELSWMGRLVISLAHLLVAFNYALGFLIAVNTDKKGTGFAIYCALFVFLWIFIMVKGYMLMTDVIVHS